MPRLTPTSPYHARELSDVLQAEAARRTPARRVATADSPVLSSAARQTPRWQRLRAAIGDHHPFYICPDEVADRVWLTLAAVPEVTA